MRKEGHEVDSDLPMFLLIDRAMQQDRSKNTVMTKCAANNVELTYVPKKVTLKVQPCDMPPLFDALKERIKTARKTKYLSISESVKLLSRFLKTVFTKDNIRAAFFMSGIDTLDKSIFSLRHEFYKALNAGNSNGQEEPIFSRKCYGRKINTCPKCHGRKCQYLPHINVMVAKLIIIS